MSDHSFFDPGNTGRCQARPVYLGIPGAIETKCDRTVEQHGRQLTEAERKLVAIRNLHEPVCEDCGASWPCPTAAILGERL